MRAISELPRARFSAGALFLVPDFLPGLCLDFVRHRYPEIPPGWLYREIPSGSVLFRFLPLFVPIAARDLRLYLVAVFLSYPSPVHLGTSPCCFSQSTPFRLPLVLHQSRLLRSRFACPALVTTVTLRSLFHASASVCLYYQSLIALHVRSPSAPRGLYFLRSLPDVLPGLRLRPPLCKSVVS